MPQYVIKFPDDWYLRGTTATGDIERADRFNSTADATKRLAQCRHYFKQKALRDHEIVPVEEAP